MRALTSRTAATAHTATTTVQPLLQRRGLPKMVRLAGAA